MDALAAVGAEGAPLHAVAAMARLPQATASRLLHDLDELGLVDQAGPRGRYRLGPRLSSLGERRAYRGRLLAAAIPCLERLRHRHDASVVLAVLRGPHRLILYEAGFGRHGRLEERDDLYHGANGRMLVAQLPWRRRRHLVATMGLPRPGQWPGVATWSELGEACAEARRRGWIEHHPRAHPLSAIGVPVPDDEGGVAAIGIAVRRSRWSPAVVHAALRSATAIARRMATGRIA